MKTELFYYTGTGNSLWAARKLSSLLGNSSTFPMSRFENDSQKEPPDVIGMIFPVHVWGLPRRVVDFVNALNRPNKTIYYFAIAVNAGQVAATLLQMKKLMAARGLNLSSGFELVMPSNYIPWGGPGPQALQQKRFRDAEIKMEKIGRIVTDRTIGQFEKGPLWQNILFSLFYRLSFSHLPAMDKSFWVDERCNGCQICKNICPCDNIDMDKNKKPAWRHHCEQCLACIQWCSQEAIQYGKRTIRNERYHHPEITAKDLIMKRESRNIE